MECEYITKSDVNIDNVNIVFPNWTHKIVMQDKSKEWIKFFRKLEYFDIRVLL